ncbi:MAG: substrate-binding domain-containing protein [Alphaproteobacteria bacterium GM202ARS2]|nr:substrate-binding domain-containing protein [Alphaproteobacteria bacterium GM202ARS2]
MTSICVATLTCVCFLAVVPVAPASAAERSHISIAGSSTVLPFAIVVAEEFRRRFPQYKTPVVESGGSSAGLKLFCTGTGLDTIDIANASRRIKDKEVKACADNGVKDFAEIVIGFDGIVFASAKGSTTYRLTSRDIYLALGEKVPSKDGTTLVDNPYTHWSQIRSGLPNELIRAFIPGVKHGTRDVFESKGLVPGCKGFADSVEAYLKKQGGGKLKKQCKKVRKDGRSVDIDGDYTVTQSRILQDPGSVGVFGFNFYYLNQGKLRIATVDGKTATFESIKDGSWPISRPLYFYVKKAHLDKVDGLKDYVEYFISDEMIGDEGLLVEHGLIPQNEEDREAMAEDFARH